uniref:Reverse transcriptase Ty1/copia-type domain-containing protein n=1 Tax=Solanum lycopersicum TaxID=4081 RepID=A0A3Q7HPN3_SOLLC
MREINNLKTRLSAAFEMKDLGPAKQILGMKISRDRPAGTLNLSQELYIEKVLSRFRVNDAKPRTTPLANHFKLSKEQSLKTIVERDHMALVPYASAVGSLMYAMVCTRPNIAHAVGVVSRYMANPGKEHWEAVKWLLRYLRGISSTSLCFGKGKVTLQGFVDADLGGDVDSSKSTSGYIYTIGGTAVSWMSRLQKCVSLSSTEAEYVAIAEAGKEMIWLANYKLKDCVATESEIRVIESGLAYCLANGFTQLIMKSDSLKTMKILNVRASARVRCFPSLIRKPIKYEFMVLVGLVKPIEIVFQEHRFSLQLSPMMSQGRPELLYHL